MLALPDLHDIDDVLPLLRNTTETNDTMSCGQTDDYVSQHR